VNITFVLPDGLTLGGVTTWSVEMGRRLVERGAPAALIEHPSRYGRRLALELPPGLAVGDCTDQVHPNSVYLTAGHVIEGYLPVYRQFLPGIIIPNWSIGAYAACAALALENAPAVRVIGFAHTDEAAYYRWLAYYEPVIHQFVAVSQEIAARLVERLPQRAADVIIRPYAVDAAPGLKRAYSAPGRPLQLVYAGRLWERQKRVSDLARLAEALAGEGVDFRLRIIGEGDDSRGLRRKIQALASATRGRLTLENSLPPPEMAAAWRAADVFILVSEYEGTSIAMLEAMAQGCVPVVTEVSGVRAVLRPGYNGFLAPVGDMAAMARLVKSLAADRTQLAQLGANAHAAVRQSFSYEDYVAWFLELAGRVETMLPRPWPAGRPLLPPDLARITRAELGRAARGDRAEIRTLLVKLMTRPGLRWLYRYRGLGRKILG
jgi:glycosyltransferase involved in cell wall biosynthesis